MDGENDGNAYQPVGIEHISPISGKKSYYPEWGASIKPVEGMIFDNLESAKSFYKRYALACGFPIRKETQLKSRGTIQGKYFVCSKEGQKAVNEVDTLDEEQKPKQKRRKPSQRTGCEARIMLELTVEGKYVVYNFIEAHNHPFVAEDDMHFISAARNLSFTKKTLLSDLSNINIGPVRAFNIMRTIFGGFNHVGATKVDCKNFKRDQNLYISEYDAEMGLFWADEYAKSNFYTFGVVLSFDATYQHNKYKMVFVPFTGIDNHNCNVTLGAALLGNETTKTYT
ncbi:protein FAR1-RELATED SEQUENCE 5-like [Bidens hawaiensis]|uniref:protein FAR1-RELATED SEQUENCE 5-like n=1 Tax=Bidens hawaiensis TaxID=980011 RepID=UPI004049AAFE